MAVGTDTRMRLRWLAALGGLVTALGCSAPNPNVRVRVMPNGKLQVTGPLAGPFKTLAELAENACDVITGQPGASADRYGMEYCALHYFVSEEQAFYLSHLSDLGGTRENGEKYCFLPATLDDPKHPTAIILGGDHSHPHNRRFSPNDLSARTRQFPTKIVDTRSGRVFHRELFLFYREKAGQCRAYKYDYSAREVAALRDGTWVPIGMVQDDEGEIELYEGKDWVP